MHRFPLLLQQNKHYHLLLQEPNAVQKSTMPTTFSQNHRTDVEEDPLLQFQRLHRHRDRIDDCQFNDIYSRVNLLILQWMLLIHSASWISRTPSFVYNFSYLAVLIAMPFTGKKVFKHPPDRILNFQCKWYPWINPGTSRQHPCQCQWESRLDRQDCTFPTEYSFI